MNVTKTLQPSAASAPAPLANHRAHWGPPALCETLQPAQTCRAPWWCWHRWSCSEDGAWTVACTCPRTSCQRGQSCLQEDESQHDNMGLNKTADAVGFTYQPADTVLVGSVAAQKRGTRTQPAPRWPYCCVQPESGQTETQRAVWVLY